MYYSYQWLKDLLRAAKSLPPAPTNEMIDRVAAPLDRPGIQETVRIGLDRFHGILGTAYPGALEAETPGMALWFLASTQGAGPLLEKFLYERELPEEEPKA